MRRALLILACTALPAAAQAQARPPILCEHQYQSASGVATFKGGRAIDDAGRARRTPEFSANLPALAAQPTAEDLGRATRPRRMTPRPSPPKPWRRFPA